MTKRIKEKWLYLYFLAQKIGDFSPWERFGENDKFSYIWKDKSKTIMFSFIAESVCRCGIACYVGEDNYMRARQRLNGKNVKNEPAFFLQNALICMWGNREDVSNDSYQTIKELGLKFRGKGCWLFFERYETGYVPVPLSENDIDLLTTAYENLHMMLRAIYEERLNPEFEKGNTLFRWYDEEDKLYYTHPLKLDMSSEKISYPVVTITENDEIQKLRDMKSSGCTVELDWSYLNVVFDDADGKESFPIAIIGVEASSGMVMLNVLLPPSVNKPNAGINAVSKLINQYGKPAEIRICDNELSGILNDFCSKVGIKLTQRKRLPNVTKARTALLSTL